MGAQQPLHGRRAQPPSDTHKPDTRSIAYTQQQQIKILPPTTYRQVNELNEKKKNE